MIYNVDFHFTMIVIGLKLCKALSELLFCINSSKPMQITRLRYHYPQPIYKGNMWKQKSIPTTVRKLDLHVLCILKRFVINYL